jgi:hypothetical protein
VRDRNARHGRTAHVVVGIRKDRATGAKTPI